MKFLMVCLVGLLVSVQASPVSPPMVSGQVRLPDGSPVAGAQVVLFDVADLRRGPVGKATTDEAGQFALPLAASTAFVLPQAVGLGQNYPNPFNPSTLIPYQLAAISPVRLEVFNVLGQRVATLVDGQQVAGAYVARWDGTDAAGGAAASGVYFYRLTVASAHQTGKMVLVDGQAGVPLGGARVAAVPLAAGSTATYGLVVAGDGLVTYVDSDFGVATGMGPVAIEMAAVPQVRMKVTVPTLEGLLGDVNADGQVDLDDGLLVAMYSVDPALSLPNHGYRTLGDVNCDGQVELADAGLLATYVAHPSAAAVASLRIGQRGGYSLNPVTEVVWGSILGTEKKDAMVARLLDGVPVLLSGVLPIDGEDRLYLGIDRAYWTAQGGKQLYEALKQRFPATPIHVEPSIGVVRQSGKATTRPTTTAIRTVAPVTRFGPPISFAESPNAGLPDHSKAQKVVGRIGVPHDVTVGSVAVAVDITHPFRGDLKIDLVAPSGVATTLYDGVREGINPEANLVGELPVSTELQGQRAKGVWQLRVGDYEQGDAGTLNSWTLTVTPAQDAEETEEPVNVFLDTFQEGLGGWRTTEWEAASLDTDSGVPGEGPGNVVAKAEGCSVCFLTLDTPVDLSAYDSVTLSFYRWMDPGTTDNEFLGIDIGNNGSYRRLTSWSGQHADGQWHLETFTLSGDQISNAFSLRFFGITTNDFTTVAIDNVMIAATPGSVVVEPVEPGEPEEDPEETEQPDLTVTYAVTPPRSVPSGNTIALYTRVTNTGTTPSAATVARIYRHTATTPTPTLGGTPETATTAIPALEPGSSILKALSATAPAIPSTYHYYVCVEGSCSEAAAVSVQTTTDTTPEPETPATVTGFSVTSATVTPPALQSTDTLTIQATITNTGTETDDAAIHVYRHTQETTTPRTGGTRESNTATTSTLAPNASVTVTSTHSAPTVLRTTRYYYYICADTFCANTPATVLVRVKPEDPGPPYARCWDVPERSTPMGGDIMFSLFIGDPGGEFPRRCGTITLGGVETTTGVRGFIASGHVVVRSTYDDETARSIQDYSRTDTMIGHGRSTGFFVKELQHFLGKVFQMPSFSVEGDKRLISTDAALVAYPHPKTAGCSLTWSGDGEDFCLDLGSDDYIERLVPLTIRGANGETYKVVGSQEPTEGLPIQVSGAVSGVPVNSVAKGGRLLLGSVYDANGIIYRYINHSRGGGSVGGDSGAPVYTVPDADGNVRIVGILIGHVGVGRPTFNSWKTIEEEFNLRPIAAPDGPTEEDEADLAGLFSAFD